MTKRILRGLAIAAMTGLVLTVHAQDTQYPTILQQPDDQCILIGGSVTFSVVATNAEAYQWYKNNVAMDGQTNSSITISGLGTTDVGYYGAAVINGLGSVPTRSALLNVYTTSSTTTTSTFTSPTRFAGLRNSTMSALSGGDGGGAIIVYSYPVFGSGGSAGTCPGKYCGYVNYTKPTPLPWGGWTPSTGTTVFTMSDTNRTDTKVQYGGNYGDSGCAQTTVTIPYPAMSPVYRFCVYFPPGATMPTNSYPIVLTGFDP